MLLTHDTSTNSLRLSMADDAAPVNVERVHGVLDVAENGRLVGVELQFDSGEDTVRHRLRRWTSDPAAAEYTTIEPDGTAYIELTSGDPDDFVVSSPVELTLESDADGALLAVSIPRRGAGYEISYPSGNR